jgi:hypothetical protein
MTPTIATRPTVERKVRRDHLEERPPRTHEDDVERPLANHPREEVEAADREIDERERDAGAGIEERDLVERPPGERRDVLEQDQHGDEVEEGDEEDPGHVERERRAVLELRANLSAHEPEVERERVSHPAPPPA